MTTPRRSLRWLVAVCVALVLPTGATAAAASTAAGLQPVAVVQVTGHDVAAVGSRSGGLEHVGKPDLSGAASRRAPSLTLPAGLPARPTTEVALVGRAGDPLRARGPPSAAARAASRGSTP